MAWLEAIDFSVQSSCLQALFNLVVTFASTLMFAHVQNGKMVFGFAQGFHRAIELDIRLGTRKR